ncbi:MAG: ATP-binding protein, partial [Oscillospiraceae bacterium]
IGPAVQFVNTQSSIINAVINSKLSKCTEEGIALDFKVTGSVCDFDEIELGILLSNLFDNAIEASAKNKADKKIEIEICDNKGYLCILMKNLLDESVMESNPELVTSKSDKKCHGIGLKSVRDIVEKHDGIINFYEEGKSFAADIWLKKPKI